MIAELSDSPRVPRYAGSDHLRLLRHQRTEAHVLAGPRLGMCDTDKTCVARVVATNVRDESKETAVHLVQVRAMAFVDLEVPHEDEGEVRRRGRADK